MHSNSGDSGAGNGDAGNGSVGNGATADLYLRFAEREARGHSASYQ
ncbi:hypothetical protein [Kitasatospora aureofaciens]